MTKCTHTGMDNFLILWHYRFLNVPCSVVCMVYDSYGPQAVVVQCGADSLAGDPLGTFNISIRGMGACLDVILQWGLPTLLLGGGKR